jgi:hypothetical protein
MHTKRWFLVTALLAGLVLATAAVAHDPEDGDDDEEDERLPSYVHEPIDVEGRADDLIGLARSASFGHVGIEEIDRRPLLREGELLEMVPGLIMTQHSGDGKSNQMFLRGFNLDHGTDFRTQVEGMPVNLPTNAHGQGYTDLNFMIPELVDYLEFKKGVYYAETGDFSSAGSARFRLARSLPRSFFKLEAGERAYSRAAAGGSKQIGPGTLLVAGELKGYDGFWDVPQNLRKRSGCLRYTLDRGGQELSLLAMAYRNDWDASDQIPLRAVEAGAITAQGQIDSTLSGASGRYSLSASWHRHGAVTYQFADVYYIHYDLELFSNFTYFLDDPDRGDQFEQSEKRHIIGASFEHNHPVDWWSRFHLITAGVQTRFDAIRGVGLYKTVDLQRHTTVREDDVLESGTGAYVSLESSWTPRLRTVLGLRGDVYWFDVDSSIAANSGSRSDGIVSPKLTVAWRRWPWGEIYLNGGLGFHSNDARGTTISVDPVSGDPVAAVDPLVRSRAAEAGFRLQPHSALSSTVALWWLELDSELLYVGDAGGTEASDGSRRIGVELTNFVRPWRSLTADLDLSFSRARFFDVPAGEDRIPGALESVITAGVAWEPSDGWHGALRVRHLGEYPLIEDDSVRARSTTLWNASAGYTTHGVRFALQVLNLFDSDDADIQYYYPSRLPAEGAAGVEDVHFHPVEPRQFRAGVRWGF